MTNFLMELQEKFLIAKLQKYGWKPMWSLDKSINFTIEEFLKNKKIFKDVIFQNTQISYN